MVTYLEYFKVLNGSTKGTVISKKDGTVLISGDTSLFIGKTKNYYMWLYKNANLIEVIPAEEVSSYKANIK